MSHAFADIAFTPAVRAAQQRDGSRASYARAFERGEDTHHDRLGVDEADFLAAARSFYLATVSSTGWPYVQHRGGPPGFVRVLDERTLAFADFAGNRQFVSVGNLAGNDRVALIVVDYATRTRLKILGRLAVRDLDAEEAAAWTTPQYPGRVQRLMTITVAAFDWNCPQHIPQRFEVEDVQRLVEERDALRGEREALRKERDALRRERDALRAQHEPLRTG